MGTSGRAGFTTIVLERDGAVATVVLNRPEVLNAVSPTLDGYTRLGGEMGPKIRWKEWEDITITDWEDAGEFVVTKDFNDAICGALEDDSPWYREGSVFGVPIVHPGTLAQAALLLMVDQQYGMEEKPEHATLHAQQDSIIYRPLKVDEKLRVRSRVADKYARRNKKWVVYEAEFRSPEGEPVYYYQQVRMVRDESENGAGRARK